jgi:sulfopyruvate decarboxylase TPP-binding subunit
MHCLPTLLILSWRGKLQADTQGHRKQVSTPPYTFALMTNSKIGDCRSSSLALHGLFEQFSQAKNLEQVMHCLPTLLILCWRGKLQADTSGHRKQVSTPPWTFALMSNSKIGDCRSSSLASHNSCPGLNVVAVFPIKSPSSILAWRIWAWTCNLIASILAFNCKEVKERFLVDSAIFFDRL